MFRSSFELWTKLACLQSFWCEKSKERVASADTCQQFFSCGPFKALAMKFRDPANALVAEASRLVVDKRDEWVNSDCEARAEQSGHLEDQALPGSGGQHDCGFLTGEGPEDRSELPFSKVFVSEKVFKNDVQGILATLRKNDVSTLVRRRSKPFRANRQVCASDDDRRRVRRRQDRVGRGIGI